MSEGPYGLGQRQGVCRSVQRLGYRPGDRSGLFDYGAESVFDLVQNTCSRLPRIGVRLHPESLFDFIQNPQMAGLSRP